MAATGLKTVSHFTNAEGEDTRIAGCPYCFGEIVAIGTPDGTMWKCVESGYLLTCLTARELEYFNLREAVIHPGPHT